MVFTASYTPQVGLRVSHFHMLSAALHSRVNRPRSGATITGMRFAIHSPCVFVFTSPPNSCLPAAWPCRWTPRGCCVVATCWSGARWVLAPCLCAARRLATPPSPLSLPCLTWTREPLLASLSDFASAARTTKAARTGRKLGSSLRVHACEKTCGQWDAGHSTTPMLSCRSQRLQDLQLLNLRYHGASFLCVPILGGQEAKQAAAIMAPAADLDVVPAAGKAAAAPAMAPALGCLTLGFSDDVRHQLPR
jgi:hypothetical protein